MAYLPMLLGLVPVVAWRCARTRHPDRLWQITGATYGLIVAPFSLGLYATYYIPILGLLTGLLGGALTLIHGPVGFRLAISLGIVPPGKVMDSQGHVAVALLNGAIWGAVYYFVGFFVDRARLRRGASRRRKRQPERV